MKELDVTLQNKTALVTGATSGVGYETARGLARLGAALVIVGRDPERTQTAAGRLRVETGSPCVEPVLADLSSLADVRRLAGELRARLPRLDVLVNNAGAIFWERELTAEGLERTWALNHLSYFLLTSLMLPSLQQAARVNGAARVLNVSSNAHYGSRIHWQDVQMERGYSTWKAYGQSKLANVMFAFELARRVEADGITANAVHPGFVASNFARNNGRLVNWAMNLLRPFSITPEQSAAALVHLAASPEMDGQSGGYYDRARPRRADRAAYNEEDCARLWELSEQMIEEDKHEFNGSHE